MVLKEYKYIGLIVACILVCFLFYKCGRDKAEVKYIDKEVKVTEIKIDTIEKRIKGDEKIITKYVDKIKEIERTKVVYDTAKCKEVVAKKDSIIIYKDSIIGRKDSIIYKDREIIKLKDTIIYKERDKVKCNKGAVFLLGVGAGVVGRSLL